MARKHQHTDPLDLLLDTMTNAFSAIIMIAISVSMLVNEAKKADGPATTSKAQMTQRKASRTTEDMVAAEKLRSELEEKLRQAGDVAQMVKDRDALKEKVQTAEAELKEPSSVENMNSADLKDKTARLSREIMTLKESAAKLTVQSLEMGKVAASKQTKQTIDLTPPSAVRDTTKSPYSLVFRHNQLYPLLVPGAGGMVRNETTVKWTDTGPIAEIEPIVGAGIDGEKNEPAVRALIANLRKINSSIEGGGGLYVAAYVYKDSFAAYLRFKQLFTAANTGIGQGWEPVPNEDNLKFGATGFKPGEQ